MTKGEIRVLREAMQLSQADFGRLFGVHAMTVSRWERDLLRPTPYQLALMQEFRRAVDKRRTEVEREVGALLVGAGVVAALLFLLQIASDTNKQ